MLFSIVYDPSISAYELNHDLDLINKWATQWKMSFNPDPNKQATEILFSQKRSKVDHPDLYFNGSVVKRATEHKHLGLTLTPKLNFENHLISKMKKAKKIIGIIKHLNRNLSLKSLDQMYKTLVRLHLEYCDFIYHLPASYQFLPVEMVVPTLRPLLESCDLCCDFNYDLPAPNQLLPGGMDPPTLMGKVESKQYQAALAVTGAWKGTSRVKIYKELGWEALSYRRSSRRILQLHKIVDKKTPPYLYNKFPPNRQG